MRPCLHFAISAATTLTVVGIPRVAAHPGCFDDGALLQDAPLVFCPVEDEGVCCTAEAEQTAIDVYNSKLDPQIPIDNSSDPCLEKWKQVCSREATFVYY